MFKVMKYEFGLLSNLSRRRLFYSGSVRHISFKLPSIGKALTEAKRIDEKYESLGNSPTKVKVEQVIKAVDGVPELLYQLNFFFYECKRIGILHDNAENRRRCIRYWPVFIFKLIPLNNAFWDICYSMEKADHRHRINPFKIADIGLLDPKNFPQDFVQQLATGFYNGVDFRDAIAFAISGPKFDSMVKKP
ncbi:hypothetical protein KGF56_001784 [Candida oxycetoniae]|uniref:Uncharacterized protein n=1 Tax=Candida oxycetoniae TaxID=497107 RepID=A0AAI9SYE4_9ASCO|nr:uncharacterized protein KGF56_001784 [Candida oxycetoniae]KAI3405388.2 hypothetical protein KGF56_001784 [Candida oxycetoniae]